MKKFLREEPVELVTPKGHRFRIIRYFCKGCRICVEFCPTGTLDLDDRFKVRVANPEKCIGCRMCELRCPDLAIFVQKAEAKQKDTKVESRSGEECKHQGTKSTKRKQPQMNTDGHG